MTVLDVIKARGSIRNYDEKPLAKDVLQQILEAARLAQSAANRQPWEFVVVTSKSTRLKLAEAAEDQDFVGEAAAVVVCLANPAKSVKVGPFEGCLIDSAIAIENMVLTAWDLGVGSCWIGAFNESDVKAILGIPENLRVISLLTLGYPTKRPRAKSRKPLEEIVHYESYGRTREQDPRK